MDSKFSGNNLYSISDLLSRGWTEELIAEFFPDSSYSQTGCESTAPHFSKQTVHTFEHDARFIQCMNDLTNTRAPSRNSPFCLPAEASALFQDALSAHCLAHASPAVQTIAAYLHAAFLAHLKRPRPYMPARKFTIPQIDAAFDRIVSLELFCGSHAQKAMQKLQTLVSLLFLNRTPMAEPRREKVAEYYPVFLLHCAQAHLNDLQKDISPDSVDKFLHMENFPVSLLFKRTMLQIYRLYYIPGAIQRGLNELLEVDPKNEYPMARRMNRHFIIHTGPTNSGKTYTSLQRMACAKSGAYLGPLRLLALEVQEKLLAEGVNCSLLTGEEENLRENSTHIASTVEKADLSVLYDVVVIDECQMIGDPQRGFAWTRAILGMQCKEIHCCVAPEGIDILKALIDSCDDTYEVEELTRFTPLTFESEPVHGYSDLYPGDAIIAFSKRRVLYLAELLRNHGCQVSVIYGRLPYPARKLQIENFLSGKSQYVVATDAIGMGLNLPVRRIVFTETSKFDGTRSRLLNAEEVRQIAGRAGRRGLNEYGYVSFWEPFPYPFSEDGWTELSYLKSTYHKKVRQLPFAYLGFSDMILQLDYDILDILKAWQAMPVQSPLYQKMDIERYIQLILEMREHHIHFTKEEELSAANIPFDERNEELNALFLSYCNCRQKGMNIPRPARYGFSIDALEMYCKKLDLYYSFGKHFGYEIDLDWIRDEKMQASQSIHAMLVPEMMAKQKKKKPRRS